jgi:hypothetical protein
MTYNTGSSSFLSDKAPVGHLLMHCPQAIHYDPFSFPNEDIECL